MSSSGGLTSFAKYIFEFNCTSVSCLAWISYDMAVHFGDEVELIWKTRWTLPKVIYLILRYYGLIWLSYNAFIALTPASNVSAAICKSAPVLGALATILFHMLVDFIMVIRIRALYQDKKSVFYVAVGAWFVASSIIIPIIAYCVALSRPIPAPRHLSMIVACVDFKLDMHKMQLAKVAVVAYVILNSFFLVLTLHKFLESVRSAGCITFRTVYTIFLGEGMAYYTAFLIVKSIDLIFSAANRSLFMYISMSQIWSAAFYSYAGSHLILHLRATNYSLQHPESFYDFADIEFMVDYTPTVISRDINPRQSLEDMTFDDNIDLTERPKSLA